MWFLSSATGPAPPHSCCLISTCARPTYRRSFALPHRTSLMPAQTHQTAIKSRMLSFHAKGCHHVTEANNIYPTDHRSHEKCASVPHPPKSSHRARLGKTACAAALHSLHPTASKNISPSHDTSSAYRTIPDRKSPSRLQVSRWSVQKEVGPRGNSPANCKQGILFFMYVGMCIFHVYGKLTALIIRLLYQTPTLRNTCAVSNNVVYTYTYTYPSLTMQICLP
jgi:hypothetical protein